MYKAFDGGAIGVKASFEEGVQLAAHFGFEGMCLNLGYLRANGPDAVVQMLEERNLQSAGWGLPVGLLGSDAEFDAQLAQLDEVADLCARAGDLRCVTWPPPASDDMAYAEMFGFLRARLEAVAGLLGRYDVRLGLEFLGPPSLRAGKKHEFIYTMEGMLELCRAVGTGNVGLLVDCWHLHTSGGQMDDVLKLSDGDVVAVHINDVPAGIPLGDLQDLVRCLPGETGIIDARRFLECLQQIGYTGPVIVEPFSERVNQMENDEAIRTTKQAMDSVWPG